MTNLLEKSLLTGFGVMVLILFFSFINPFLVYFTDFDQKLNQEIKLYIDFFDEVDQGIVNVLDRPNSSNLSNITYPKDLNITLDGYFIKYDYIIENTLEYKIFEYEKPFFSKSFHNYPSRDYLLYISNKDDTIEIQFDPR